MDKEGMNGQMEVTMMENSKKVFSMAEEFITSLTQVKPTQESLRIQICMDLEEKNGLMVRTLLVISKMAKDKEKEQ